MEEVLVMERNFARDVGLFSPPRKPEKRMAVEYREVGSDEEMEVTLYRPDGTPIKKTVNKKEYSHMIEGMKRGPRGEVLEPVNVPSIGYRDSGRSVYLPVEFAVLLKDLPFARVVLAGIVTLWEEKGATDGLFSRRGGQEKLRMAEVNTTLWEICKVIGLNPSSGRNRERVKDALKALHYTRYKNLVFFNVEVEEKRGKKRIEARQEFLTVLVPTLEFRDAIVDGKKADTTVRVLICEPLTQSLLLDTPKARIPLAALKATYDNTRATRAMQNVLFWLSAVTPERPGQPLHLKTDTLINDVMKAEDKKRSKKIKRLEHILNDLQKIGFIAWWKFDGEHCVIMKKRDQEVLERKRKKKALVLGDTQCDQINVHLSPIGTEPDTNRNLTCHQ